MKLVWGFLAAIAIVVASTQFWPATKEQDYFALFEQLADTATPQRFIKSTTAIGTIKPQVGAEVKVGSQVSGIVRQLKVNIGDRVNKGDVLAKLDDRQQQLQWQLKREEVQQQQAELTFSQLQLDTLKALDNTSERDLKHAQNRVTVNQSLVKQAQIQVQQAKLNLANTQIIAPISGTIASINTYEGETVAASFAAPTFVNIIDLSRLEVQTYVDETDIGSVYVGQAVDFRLESFPEHLLKGKVMAIRPKPDVLNDVVNYVVIIHFEQPDKLNIRTDMTAIVDFVLAEKTEAIVLPGKALLKDGGQYYVVVKTQEGWQRRPVKIGLRDAGQFEITQGLKAGEHYLSDKKVWQRYIQGLPAGASAQ